MNFITLAKMHQTPKFDPLNPPQEKTCCKCEVTKPRKEFARRATNYDMLDHMCKTCRKQEADEKKAARDKYREQYFNF